MAPRQTKFQKRARTARVRLDVALELFDNNQSALARFFQVNRGNVSQWQDKGLEYLPDYRALQMVLSFPEVEDKS